MTTVTPQTKTNKEVSKEVSGEASKKTSNEASNETPPGAMVFGTPEEEAADANAWDEQFAATPDDKLNKLIGVVQSKIRAGNTSPLDFTNK